MSGPVLPTQSHQLAKIRFRVCFAKVCVVTALLPLIALLYCVAASLLEDFRSATYTHCRVANYLPSVSAAIGNGQRQRTVWLLAILLHLPVRLIVLLLYVAQYSRRLNRRLALAAGSLHLSEHLALCCLSLWTSSAHHALHRNAFLTFVGCSEIYMLLAYLLQRRAHRLLALLPWELRSLRLKRSLLLANLCACLLAALCYLRHNSHCEAGVYTLFALCEYIVVLTNVGFHLTAFWDFHGLHLVCAERRGLYLTYM